MDDDVWRNITQYKVLAGPQLTNIEIPHIPTCTASNYTMEDWEKDETLKVALVHYYSKSMEEFLIETDQFMPPYMAKNQYKLTLVQDQFVIAKTLFIQKITDALLQIITSSL